MKLLFLGDFFFDYEEIPEDFEDICDFVRKNDLHVILNLETAFSDKGTKIKKRGPNLLSSGLTIKALKKLNVIAVCLANNHSMDYGGAALTDMLSMLDREGIAHVGAGRNIEEAQKELLLKTDGKNLVLQNCGWNVEETVYASKNSAGCAPYLKEAIIQNTKRLKEYYHDAIIVTCFHWGFEYNLLPMPMDIDTAHRCIEAGSDLIIGHHPHVVQTKEKWNGKNIYYSLGNFYFSSRRKSFHKEFACCDLKYQCDIGIGIVFDTETLETNICKVEYDRSNDRSIICFGQEELVKDMALWDWKERGYENDVKYFRNNFNPILTTDESANERKLRGLRRKYWLARHVSVVKKTRLGRKLIRFLRDRMK